MKQSLLVFLTLLFGLTSNNALADKKVKQVAPGQVAWHFVANLTPTIGGPPELVGYLAFIEGVTGPMFSHVMCPPAMPDIGAPAIACAEDAFFTLRVRPLTSGAPVVLVSADPGAVQGLLLLPGLMFDIFLNRDPNMTPQTWDNLDAFSDGELVATFRESALMSATEMSTTGDGALYNLFSSKLVFAKTFEYHGQRINFKKLVPNGTTGSNFGNTKSGAAMGTAIALGKR